MLDYQKAIDAGRIRVSDNFVFRVNSEIRPLFGLSQVNNQRGFYSVDPEHKLWLPHLSVIKNGVLTATGGSGWFNLISDDWTEIYESPPESSEIAAHPVEPFDRYVFIRMRPDEFRFIGVFTGRSNPEVIDGVRYELQTRETNGRRYKVHYRVANEIDLIPYLSNQQL